MKVKAEKNKKLDLNLTTYTNAYSKWNKNINIRPKTLNYIQENIKNAPKTES